VEKQGTFGLKPQPHKNLTEPKPFKLASDERSVVHKIKEIEVEVRTIFKLFNHLLLLLL